MSLHCNNGGSVLPGLEGETYFRPTDFYYTDFSHGELKRVGHDVTGSSVWGSFVGVRGGTPGSQRERGPATGG